VRCEVVAIGTELLLGQIVDTNSSWIGEQLALIGIDSHFQVKVGDNPERMEFCLRQALDRSDAVICCGGLGPTQDDITREVIARVMGVELRRDEAMVRKIESLFEKRGRVMTDNNRRQADIPEGAYPIPDMPGTAPGLVCPVGDKVIYAVPGVPDEMHEMMQGTILPDLQRRSGQTSVIRSRVLRTWGHSESGLAEILAPRIDELDPVGNPTLAFLASGIEGLKVRITAKAEDEASAERIIAAEEKIVRGLLGDLIFGIDEQTMESVVLDDLRARGMTLAVAESLTGGIMSSRLTALDPAMAVFRGASVAAPSDAALAGEGRALAEAERVKDLFGTDVGLAAVAPGEGDGELPGTVFLGLVIGGGRHAQRISLPGDLKRMRNYSVIGVMNFLRKTLAST
jgi:nicotinamide-nucleotide amidase